jgi:hypothetical protein
MATIHALIWVVLKPIWSYGIQLCGMFPVEDLAHDSGRTMVVPNTVIQRDLQIPTVKEEIRPCSCQYSARLRAHPNGLVVNLMEPPNTGA